MVRITTLFFSLIALLGCRSDFEKAIERQYRGGIRSDEVWRTLRLGMHADSVKKLKIDSLMAADLGFQLHLKYDEDSLLRECIVTGLYDSVMYRLDTFLRVFDYPGEEVLIPSEALDTMIMRLDGNKLLRLKKDEYGKWQANINDLWQDSVTFSKLRL